MAEPRYQKETPIVDARYSPSAHLLQHVEGSAWAVDYYAQMLGPASEPTPQQIGKPAAQQQYTLIRELELKVTAPLTPQQNTENNTFDVVGAASIFARVVPNKGDMFLADAGDGRLAVFTLTNVEKKTYLRDAVYAVEYKLVDYANEERLEDLKEKTVRTLLFKKDFLQFGQNPLILSEDFGYHIQFKDAYHDLLGLYMHDFFSREYNTLLIPDQQYRSYDPFLTKRFLDWVSTKDHPYVNRIVLPNVSGDKAMDQITVWDCLSRLNGEWLHAAMQEARLLDTIYFKHRPHLGGIFFTGIERVMYPRDPRTDVDADFELPVTDAGQALRPGDPRFSDLQRLLDTPLNGFSYTPAAEGLLPDIVPVTHDKYYVFSEGFYRPGQTFRSNLEKLVKDVISQKPVDKAVVERLVKHAPNWGNLERFYYIPALLVILKVIIRTN